MRKSSLQLKHKRRLAEELSFFAMNSQIWCGDHYVTVQLPKPTCIEDFLDINVHKAQSKNIYHCILQMFDQDLCINWTKM